MLQHRHTGVGEWLQFCVTKRLLFGPKRDSQTAEGVSDLSGVTCGEPKTGRGWRSQLPGEGPDSELLLSGGRRKRLPPTETFTCFSMTECYVSGTEPSRYGWQVTEGQWALSDRVRQSRTPWGHLRNRQRLSLPCPGVPLLPSLPGDTNTAVLGRWWIWREPLQVTGPRGTRRALQHTGLCANGVCGTQHQWAGHSNEPGTPRHVSQQVARLRRMHSWALWFSSLSQKAPREVHRSETGGDVGEWGDDRGAEGGRGKGRTHEKCGCHLDPLGHWLCHAHGKNQNVWPRAL